MTYRLMLSGSLLAFALLAGSATVPSSQAHAYACKSTATVASAQASQVIKARKLARQAWTASVKSKYGLPWSLWKYAEDKSVTCKHGGSKWRCTASAKPCKYVVQ